MVACITSGRRTRVTGRVTIVTRNCRVCACERETGQVVIKCCRRPATRRVTLLAQRGESCSHVIRITDTSVIAVMAGIARGRRPSVSGCVATVACHGGVRSRERESAQIVIE